MESDEFPSVSNYHTNLQNGFYFSSQEWAENSALVVSKLKKGYV